MSNPLASILESSTPSDVTCFNPEGLRYFLGRELAESNRYGYFSSLALFRLGSSLSGEDLQKLLRCLSQSIRSTDFLGMVDDNTVGLILQHASVQSADNVVCRLRSEISNVLPAHNGNAVTGAFAVFPTEANTLESLERLAKSRLEN